MLIQLAENGKLPDWVTRLGIKALLYYRKWLISTPNCEIEIRKKRELVEQLSSSPLAVEQQAANDQHYELPPEFFHLVLGPNKKYSSCNYESAQETLQTAEERALDLVVQRAAISDGMSILELGCGWGSLSLYMAKRYPNSKITVVSNSNNQRLYIESKISEFKLSNLTVITKDIVSLSLSEKFDRIVSIEMFEHLRNYKELFGKLANWLNPDGRVFVHVFCHRNSPYLFEIKDKTDWMAKYFFSGGTMPSDDLFYHFQEDLEIINHWRVNGRNYALTSEAWLTNLDNNKDLVMPILKATYGEKESARWMQRWRIFFMSCAELFGFSNGNEWFVSHYLFKPQR